jgi:maleate isomerase
VAARIESEIGIPVYDTVATGLWQALRIAGADPARLAGWGSLFSFRPDAPRVAKAATASLGSTMP